MCGNTHYCNSSRVLIRKLGYIIYDNERQGAFRKPSNSFFRTYIWKTYDDLKATDMYAKYRLRLDSI